MCPGQSLSKNAAKPSPTPVSDADRLLVTVEQSEIDACARCYDQLQAAKAHIADLTAEIKARQSQDVVTNKLIADLERFSGLLSKIGDTAERVIKLQDLQSAEWIKINAEKDKLILMLMQQISDSPKRKRDSPLLSAIKGLYKTVKNLAIFAAGVKLGGAFEE